MFNMRRALRPIPSEDVPVSAPDNQSSEDPLAELVRLVDADLNGPDASRRRPISPDELAEALAAELGTSVDSFDPIDPRTGTVRPGHRGYDPWDDAALDEIAQEFNRMQEEVAPAITGPGILPPHDPAETEAAPHARSRLPLILASVAALALVAGAGIGWMFLSGPTGFGQPVLVQAPTGPYKIVPEAGDTIPEPADNVIFSPDGGVPPKGEERLVTRSEEIPDLPGVTPQVNRVTLPDGQELAPEPVAPVDTGPRKVRTVLVKPDGTIIESPDGPVPSLPTPQQAAVDAPLAAPQDQSGVGRLIAEEDPDSNAGLPPLQPAEQVGAEPAPAEPAAAGAASGLPDLPGDPPVAAAPVEEQPVAVQPAPADPVAAEAPPADVAATEPAPTPRLRPAAPKPAATAAPAGGLPKDGPLDLAAAAAKPGKPVADAGATRSAAIDPAPAAEPAPVAAPAAAGSAFVQVSSQRSQDAALAAFRSMQKKFPNILGGLSPDVQRADLGAKGVYYRVRVAQPTREEAAALCSSLKSAGADCLLAKR